jgi:hypothetical protein
VQWWPFYGTHQNKLLVERDNSFPFLQMQYLLFFSDFATHHVGSALIAIIRFLRMFFVLSLLSMPVCNSPLIWSRVLTLATAARYSVFEPNRLSSFAMKDTFPSSRLQVLSAGKFMRRLFPVGGGLVHPDNVTSPQNLSSSKEQASGATSTFYAAHHLVQCKYGRGYSTLRQVSGA